MTKYNQGTYKIRMTKLEWQIRMTKMTKIEIYWYVLYKKWTTQIEEEHHFAQLMQLKKSHSLAPSFN